MQQVREFIRDLYRTLHPAWRRCRYCGSWFRKSRFYDPQTGAKVAAPVCWRRECVNRWWAEIMGSCLTNGKGEG